MSTIANIASTVIDRRIREESLYFRSEQIKYQDDLRKFEKISWKHRKEDIEWRREELAQMKLQNRRREIDGKNEQLRSVATISAVVLTFNISVLVELNLNPETPDWLNTLYAATSSILVCLTTFTFVTCTLILVATLRMCEVTDNFAEDDDDDNNNNNNNVVDLTFDDDIENSFKENQDLEDIGTILVKNDWNRAYTAFSIAIPFMLLNTALASWVKFIPTFQLSPGILVAVLCGITTLFVFFSSQMKWGITDGKS